MRLSNRLLTFGARQPPRGHSLPHGWFVTVGPTVQQSVGEGSVHTGDQRPATGQSGRPAAAGWLPARSCSMPARLVPFGPPAPCGGWLRQAMGARAAASPCATIPTGLCSGCREAIAAASCSIPCRAAWHWPVSSCYLGHPASRRKRATGTTFWLPTARAFATTRALACWGGLRGSPCPLPLGGRSGRGERGRGACGDDWRSGSPIPTIPTGSSGVAASLESPCWSVLPGDRPMSLPLPLVPGRRGRIH